jgi:NADH-ubiquinone oxidoreductase chain 5
VGTRLRWASLGLFFIGSLTILMAGAAALYESDIKKVVALSTLSQLGVIILTLGGGHLVAAFFHLLSHAYFKALLFITVGAIIHRAGDFQDIRKTSISPTLFPLTLAFRLGANLSLCGLPFLSGFFSKDLCIELSVAFVNR